MKNIIIYIAAFIAISCVPSTIHPEISDSERNQRWRACSFYVIDHDCGMISEDNARYECSIEAEATYISQSSGRQRHWLRTHGCPSHIIGNN